MSTAFYDGLAPFYHLIFADWEASVAHQAGILHEVIQAEWGPGVRSVLDVSCGIGTQALGLAQLGYDVTASDLSAGVVDRARREAEQRQLRISFSVADMRRAYAHHQRAFDLLISCDNSVPHLLSDAEILRAFSEFYRCIRPGGGCLITVRDYDREDRSGTQIKPYGVRQEGEATYVIFQVWQFEGDQYDLSMYVVRDDGGSEGVAHIFRSRYYAVSPVRLEALLREAGFRQVHRADSAFYQPVIVGSK